MRIMQLNNARLIIYFFNIEAVCQKCHRNVDLALLLLAHCSAQMNNSYQAEKEEIISYLT
jgi:hypothetical protein